MSAFPVDFEVPMDQGGPGAGQPIGGFGGNPSKLRPDHQAAVKLLGRTPVLLIHGNSGSADSGQWDMLDLRDMLMSNSYPPELIWAPSYLGAGELDLSQPHTNNVEEVRQFIEAVCNYLDVNVVDIIAHSLGCTLAYAVFRGLKKQAAPIDFDRPKKWHRVGTFVSLSGAFHGLGPFSVGEWNTDGEFMRELLIEQGGGGGETPFGQGKPQTEEPAHNIVYFCGIPRGDFIDSQNQNTGMLAGGVNQVYNLGQGVAGHEAIKENRAVFNDFFPLLNSSPPIPPTVIEIHPNSGHYNAPLQIEVAVAPSSLTISAVAARIIKSFQNGFITETVLERLEESLNSGEAITLENDGLWQGVFDADGSDTVQRTYWVGVEAVTVTILTDNATPFSDSLDVMALCNRGELYHSFNGQNWTRGANTTITEDTIVYFIAIAGDGIASLIVHRAYQKAPAYEEAVTANAVQHFIAGRIDVDEYLAYSQQFGFFTPFTLYLIDGRWVIDPQTSIINHRAPEVVASHDAGAFSEPIALRLSACDRIDPNPRIFFTLDGSPPTFNSPFLTGSGQIELKKAGHQKLRYFALNKSGRASETVTRSFEMAIVDPRPWIRIKAGDPLPGQYMQALTTTIEAHDAKKEPVTVFYTTDGSLPNERSSSFKGSRTFEIAGRGQHAVSCGVKDGDGNLHYEVFHYTIDDQDYPETGIAPSRGGIFAGFVRVELTPSEEVAWTKYTTDGSLPDEDNGLLYNEPIRLTANTLLKWRSLDPQGNLEPVKSAFFEVTQEESLTAVFDNHRKKAGSIKSSLDGRWKTISASDRLVIGSDRQGRISRAILHFDTAALPDNAEIQRAYLSLEYAARPADSIETPPLTIDIKTGYFGSSLDLQADDWDAASSAQSIAQVNHAEKSGIVSSDFDPLGLKAINRTGVTQMRLRLDGDLQNPSRFVMLKPGAKAKLFVEYRIGSGGD